jgi:hypothetical protein
LDRQRLILEAARQVISDMAPEELPLLTPISVAYFANPEDTLRARQSKDKPLGFGVPGDVAQLVTPIALAVVMEVVAFLAEELRKSLKAEAPGVINDLVRSMFKKLRRTEPDAQQSAVIPEQSSAPTLTRQQLIQVREMAVQKGRQLGLTAKRANLLADSLVGGLAVTT